MFSHDGGARWRAAIISAVLAIALYVAIALWADAGRFREAVGRLGGGTLVAALALSLVNYALRAVRWQRFLAVLGHALAPGAAAANYVAGFALTTTPGKAGEAFRSLVLKRRHGVPVVDSLGAFFAERFSDVLALVILSGLALSMLPHGTLLAAIALGAVGVGLWIIASESRTARLAHAMASVLPHRFAAPLASLMGQAGRLARGRTLLAGLALALVAWAAEAWALHLIVAAVGGSMPVATAMGVYAAALLGGAVFFLPGGLGSTEALMFALLVQAGLDAPSAGAVTVVSRVTTLWFAVLLGWIALPSQK